MTEFTVYIRKWGFRLLWNMQLSDITQAADAHADCHLSI